MIAEALARLETLLTHQVDSNASGTISLGTIQDQLSTLGVDFTKELETITNSLSRLEWQQSSLLDSVGKLKTVLTALRLLDSRFSLLKVEVSNSFKGMVDTVSKLPILSKEELFTSLDEIVTKFANDGNTTMRAIQMDVISSRNILEQSKVSIDRIERECRLLTTEIMWSPEDIGPSIIARMETQLNLAQDSVDGLRDDLSKAIDIVRDDVDDLRADKWMTSNYDHEDLVGDVKDALASQLEPICSSIVELKQHDEEVKQMISRLSKGLHQELNQLPRELARLQGTAGLRLVYSKETQTTITSATALSPQKSSQIIETIVSSKNAAHESTPPPLHSRGSIPPSSLYARPTLRPREPAATSPSPPTENHLDQVESDPPVPNRKRPREQEAFLTFRERIAKRNNTYQVPLHPQPVVVDSRADITGFPKNAQITVDIAVQRRIQVDTGLMEGYISEAC